ncbi:MAG: N-acetyltransferase [Planctomycetes bacterium]|nr:N-acetyltransferase [Planctomycetota bacterium]
MLRHASINDIPAIGKIINDCAESGLMLHRSMADLYENMRDFHVVIEDHKVVGVCGLKIVWASMAEVYALAVAPEYRGRGLGRQLVLSVIDEAEELGLPKLMTLTYEKEFFARLGFETVDRQSLPLKVWSECVRCPKNQACDEVAMVRTLETPENTVPAEPPRPVQVDVPVQLTVYAGQHRQNVD